MRAITSFVGAGAAIAALASAAPTEAQYYPGYGYPGYGVPGGGYGAGRQDFVVNECVGAVRARIGGYGYGYGPAGRVLGISSVSPREDGGLTVRGVATSGRYGPYGAPNPDLTWRCRTGFRGNILEVTVNRAYGAYGGYTPYKGYDYSQYGYVRY
jgi:hypothetical protein